MANVEPQVRIYDLSSRASKAVKMHTTTQPEPAQKGTKPKSWNAPQELHQIVNLIASIENLSVPEVLRQLLAQSDMMERYEQAKRKMP